MKTSEVAAGSAKQGFIRREMSQWFGNVVGDLWGGAVTTFALLPEVIGFMIVVGVDPYWGLFTCICLTVLLAFIGGRPGMISAGAGATALLLVGLISQYKDTHPEYIFAAVVLAGLIQLVLGLCRVGSLVKFIPECVMHGFVNGFATVILISQLKLCLNPNNRSVEMYILIAAGIGIIVAFPFLKKVVPFLKKVPESFVCIVLVTAYALIFNSSAVRIGDLGSVTASFDHIGSVFVNIGGIFSGECLGAIIGPAVSIAFVGLIESLLTARLVDTETETDSNKNREVRAQGIGNIVCGMVGAMPGCGMIAMTVTNLKSGGKGRLSQFVAGVLMAALLFSVPFLLEAIPLAALCAVMFVVVFHTINWDSIVHAAKVPVKETIAMAITAIIVVATDNLALGVGSGLVLFAIFYLFKRFTPTLVWMNVAYACVTASIGVGISGFFGFIWGFPIAMGLCALGAGLASMVRNESDKANLKTIATITMIVCIGLGVAATAGASIYFEMGPWYSLMSAAVGAGE